MEPLDVVEMEMRGEDVSRWKSTPAQQKEFQDHQVALMVGVVIMFAIPIALYYLCRQGVL